MTSLLSSGHRFSHRIARLFPGDAQRVQHAMLLFYMTCAVLLISSGFITYFLILSVPFGILSCSVSLVSALIEFIILLVFRKVKLASHFFCFSTLTFFLTSIYFTNGLHSPYIPWLVMAPLTASLLLGMRGTNIWGIAMLFSYVMIALGTRFNVLADTTSYMYFRNEVAVFAAAGFFCYTLILIFLSERARFDRLRLERLIHSDQIRKQSTLQQVMDGRELERQRIARELHDGLNAHLTALRLQYQMVLRGGNSESAIAGNIMKEMDGLTSRIHQLSQRLSVHVLRDFGLDQAIRHLIRQSTAERPCEVDFFMDQNGSISSELELPLFRMSQTALEIFIHTFSATHIELQILALPGLVRVMTDANGKTNLPPQARTQMESDMQEVRDYMSVFHGEMFLEFEETGHCSLIIEIPLHHE